MEKFSKHEVSIEDATSEEVFQNYMEDLKLSPEDFDKKILDVGSGSGKFAKWAKEHHVSSDIYSLEPVEELQEKTKGVRGQAEAIPFQDETFDLVISDAAIPNVFLGENPLVVKEKVKASFLELLRVTKSGGEIRLGRVLKGEVYEPQKKLSAAIDETLKELEKVYGVEVKEIPYPVANTYEYENHKPTRLLAKAYLITILKSGEVDLSGTKTGNN